MIRELMDSETLIVPRAEFSMESPWDIPPACRPVEFLRATDGSKSRLRTTAALFADDTCLTAVFSGDDDGKVATLLDHDAPLYQEDVFEIFLSTGDITSYFEIEVNPMATTFDARIASPDGVRATMRAELEWTCHGLFAAARMTPRSFEAVLRFPFGSVAAAAPRNGTAWRGNLFRIDRSRQHGDEFMAWQPTLRNPPDFHVVAAFGRLEFA